jgi:hypothetical protein
LLANICLHYVFDLWAARWRRHHARGNIILVRYADDTVAGFEYQADAKRFQAELQDRLAQFALTLHSDKTRLIQFGRQAAEERERAGLGKPETFDFLGFTGWDRINGLADQWLPKPRILHPWPNQRFAVKHPRWEPHAGMPHVRFCAGGAR